MISLLLPVLIDSVRDVRVDIDGEKPTLPTQEKSLKSKRSLQKWKSFPNNANNSFKGTPRTKSKKWAKDMYSDILQIDGNPLPSLPEEVEAVGIITMEDVIEELLQVQIKPQISGLSFYDGFFMGDLHLTLVFFSISGGNI